MLLESPVINLFPTWKPSLAKTCALLFLKAGAQLEFLKANAHLIHGPIHVIQMAACCPFVVIGGT